MELIDDPKDRARAEANVDLHRKGQRCPPGEILAETGFIGCGEAPQDVSSTYKEEVRRSVAAKHGHR